jgi:hypothetical protein
MTYRPHFANGPSNFVSNTRVHAREDKSVLQVSEMGEIFRAGAIFGDGPLVIENREPEA